MKISWGARGGRFKAVAVLQGQDEHLLFSQSFFGFHGKTEERLAVFTACVNSVFSVYCLYLSSGRLASYRPSLRVNDVRALPMPRTSDLSLGSLRNMSLEQIDNTVFDLYELNGVHRALVGDFFDVTLQDFKTIQTTPGMRPVWESSTSASALDTYSDWFLRVLQSGFGSDKGLCATIFRSPDPSAFPFCVVGIHLDWARSERIRYEDVRDGNLLGALEQCAQDELSDSLETQAEAIYYRRVSRIYQTLLVKEGRKKRNVPTVFLIKPNQERYWTRSVALRDADNVLADLVKQGFPDQPNEETRLA